MITSMWAAESSRKIRKRICVTGDLILQTPACLGNGDADDAVDMPLLVDPSDGRTPLLTGASLAGALRSFLREWEHGYEAPARSQSHTVALFGGNREDPEGEQSRLIIDDALGRDAHVELRHEVGLDPRSRTAAEDRLFNRQLWAAGTRFTVRFELIITDGDDEAGLIQALATALMGLQRGEIALGARKRRGYGLARVETWTVKRYDLGSREDLFAWLRDGTASGGKPDGDICQGLGTAPLVDKRRHFDLSATFSIQGTLLMAATASAEGPDKIHIRSRRQATEVPVAPGTGIAGALRARSKRIAWTLLAADETRADKLVDSIFGPRKIESGVPSFASALEVWESEVTGGEPDWVQFRIRIDRFTGGVLPGALFNAQPLTGGQVSLRLRLRNPERHQIGLLLLLLKDLWTGDLPLGGETSIGRGRLKGIEAALTLSGPEGKQRWTISDPGSDGLAIEGDTQILENYVSTHLNEWIAQREKETRHGE